MKVRPGDPCILCEGRLPPPGNGLGYRERDFITGLVYGVVAATKRKSPAPLCASHAQVLHEELLTHGIEAVVLTGASTNKVLAETVEYLAEDSIR